MTMTSPGVSENTARKNGAVRSAPKMRGLETACELLGSQSALADALAISPRLLRAKMAAERPITNEEVGLAVKALRARSKRVADLADSLLDLIA